VPWITAVARSSLGHAGFRPVSGRGRQTTVGDNVQFLHCAE
jgi:hypothetical protein